MVACRVCEYFVGGLKQTFDVTVKSSEQVKRKREEQSKLSQDTVSASRFCGLWVCLGFLGGIAPLSLSLLRAL